MLFGFPLFQVPFLRQLGGGRFRWGYFALTVGVVLVTQAPISGSQFRSMAEPTGGEPIPERSAPFRGGSWPTGDALEFGYDAKLLDLAIDRIGEQEGIYGVLVVRRSHLVAERYFREASRTKSHNLKSSSKSIISALIGLLVEDGKLSLDDSVVERLRVRGVSADRSAITVRDLLRMASGLTSTSYESYGAWIASSDWVKGALALPLLHEPGTQYRYSTGNTHMLSALVRQASGMSTRTFAEERLFGPLGIQVLGWETDPKGIHIGGNNLALLPRDMARLGQLYLQGGAWEGKQVIPRRWVEQSTSIQIEVDHEIYGDYGYQWFVPSAESLRGDFIAVGYGGQYIYVSPRLETVIVVTSTLESKGRAWEERLFAVIQGDLLQGGKQAVEQSEKFLLTSTRPAVEGTPSATELPSNPEEPRADVKSAVRQQDEAAIQLAVELETAQVQLANQQEAASAFRQKEKGWVQERRELDALVTELRASRKTLQRSLELAGMSGDTLRRREETLVAAAESKAESEAQKAAQKAVQEAAQAAELAEAALATKTALTARLRESSETIARQAEQLDEVRRDLKRSRAEKETERIVAQQAVQTAEQRRIEAELTTERSRADQALRELGEAKTLAQQVEQQRSLAVDQGDRARERELAAEQALVFRGQRLAAVREEVEALQEETKSLRADLEAERTTAIKAQNLLADSRKQSEELRDNLARQVNKGSLQSASFDRAQKLLERRLEAAKQSREKLEEEERKNRVRHQVEVAELEEVLASARRDIERSSRNAAVSLEERSAIRTDREAELVRLRESVATAEAGMVRLQAERSNLQAESTDAEGEVSQLNASLREVDAELIALRQEATDNEEQWAVVEAGLHGRLVAAQEQAEVQARANDTLGRRLASAQADAERIATDRGQSESVQAREKDALDVERRELLLRLDSRERSIKDLRLEVSESQERIKAGADAANLKKSYEQLLAESEMLARRSGEQAEKIVGLERRLRAQENRDLARRVKELLAEVDRMLGDRRLNGLLRSDLSRLRGTVAELGKSQ